MFAALFVVVVRCSVNVLAVSRLLRLCKIQVFVLESRKRPKFWFGLGSAVFGKFGLVIG